LFNHLSFYNVDLRPLLLLVWHRCDCVIISWAIFIQMLWKCIHILMDSILKNMFTPFHFTYFHPKRCGKLPKQTRHQNAKSFRQFCHLICMFASSPYLKREKFCFNTQTYDKNLLKSLLCKVMKNKNLNCYAVLGESINIL